MSDSTAISRRRRDRRFDEATTEVTNQNGAAELRHTISEMAVEGSRPEKGWGRCVGEGRRFDAWHREVFGTSIEARQEHSSEGEDGLVVFPAWLWLGWVAALLAETNAKRVTVRDKYLRSLRTWLRGTGWNLKEVDDVTPLVDNAVDNWWAEREAGPETRRAGRPVLAGEGLEEITDTIDSYFSDTRVSDYWVWNLRTFHLLTWYSAARISELVVHARWSWVSFVGEQLHVKFPGGLKFQPEPKTVVVDPHPYERRYCAVTAVRELKAEANNAGVPTGPGDPVFGWARKLPLGARNPVHNDSHEGWPPRRRRANTAWIADPIGEYLADPTWMKEMEEAERKYTAGICQAQRYRVAWKQAASDAGFEPRHSLERISPHGIRRGQATSMAQAGAGITEVAAKLRHSGWSVTADYIDVPALEPLDVSALIGEAPSEKEGDEEQTASSVQSFAGALEAEVDEAEAKDYKTAECQVPLDAGGVCGREATETLVEWGRVCGQHARRHRRGYDMGVAIKKKSGPKPRCQVVMDSGEVCGRKGSERQLAGIGWACPQHCRRYDRNEEMGVPFVGRAPKGQLCQVKMDTGQLCGRGGPMSSDDESEWICLSHRERRRKGTRMGKAWRRYSPKGQTCQVRMDSGGDCGRGGTMNWLDQHGWVCDSHARRKQQGYPMGKAWRKAKAPNNQRCEVPLDGGGACGRSGKLVWVEGYGWICGAHYQRSTKGRYMEAPIDEPMSFKAVRANL